MNYCWSIPSKQWTAAHYTHFPTTKRLGFKERKSSIYIYEITSAEQASSAWSGFIDQLGAISTVNTSRKEPHCHKPLVVDMQ